MTNMDDMTWHVTWRDMMLIRNWQGAGGEHWILSWSWTCVSEVVGLLEQSVTCVSASASVGAPLLHCSQVNTARVSTLAQSPRSPRTSSISTSSMAPGLRGDFAEECKIVVSKLDEMSSRNIAMMTVTARKYIWQGSSYLMCTVRPVKEEFRWLFNSITFQCNKVKFYNLTKCPWFGEKSKSPYISVCTYKWGQVTIVRVHTL